MAAAILVPGSGIGVADGPAAAAADDPTEGGLWYYTAPGLPEIHDSGVTGEGITIAVIDGPIYPDSPDLAGTDLILPETSFCDSDSDGIPEPVTSTSEVAERATALTSLIIGTGAGIDGEPGVQGVAPGATVRLYVHRATESIDCALDGRNATTLAVEQAIDDGADIISMSFHGWGGMPAEAATIARAHREGVILVAAANSVAISGMGAPAGNNGVISVEAAGPDLRLTPDATTHRQLAVVAPGTAMRVLTHESDWQQYDIRAGSPLATAWTSGVLALAWSANPDATPNQMIQALLRTTAQSDGDLTRIDDDWGYGTVHTRTLVAFDPTTLPDENPLLDDFPGLLPSYRDVMAPDPGATPEATTEVPDAPPTDPAAPPTDAAAPPTDPTSGLPPALIIVLANLLVLTAAAVAAVLIRRRARTGTPRQA